jgi:hypothetical protein
MQLRYRHLEKVHIEKIHVDAEPRNYETELLLELLLELLFGRCALSGQHLLVTIKPMRSSQKRSAVPSF